MKRLLLLRHAEANGFDRGPDRERTLTDNGLSDAKALGGKLKRERYIPDFIFCSPAKRTQQTLAQLSLDGIKTEKPENIYNGSSGDLLSYIQRAPEEAGAVMVVAHNPGIYQLAAMLAAEGNSDLITRLLSHGYRPGTCSILQVAADNWADIQPGANELIDLLEPEYYNVAG